MSKEQKKRCIDLVFSLIYTQPNNAISCACRTLLTRIPFDLETYMVNYLFQSKKKSYNTLQQNKKKTQAMETQQTPVKQF